MPRSPVRPRFVPEQFPHLYPEEIELLNRLYDEGIDELTPKWNFAFGQVIGMLVRLEGALVGLSLLMRTMKCRGRVGVSTGGGADAQPAKRSAPRR